MFRMTRAIYQELSENTNLKVFTEEYESHSEVWRLFGIKNGGDYKIRFINRDDDADTSVRVFSLVSVEDSHRASVMEALNTLNNKYRYIKFVLDDDNDVNLEYDYPLNCPNPAASAEELVIRIVKMVDDSYPEIMRAIWS